MFFTIPYIFVLLLINLHKALANFFKGANAFLFKTSRIIQCISIEISFKIVFPAKSKIHEFDKFKIINNE